MSLNEIFFRAGIYTSYSIKVSFTTTFNRQIRAVYLHYNGKTILRPDYKKAIETVNREFNLNLTEQ